MKTKVLVTGGAGFIGSSLIKKLIEQDFKIISLDNYSSGNKSNEIINEKVTYLTGNTWDILNIKELKDFKPDIIYHFGEFSRIFLSFKNINKMYMSNMIGTQQVLEYAVLNNSKLVYSGSSAIFGNDMKDQNLSPYSWTKSKNIELIHNYKKWFNLNFAICYFYNVYGSGQICEGSYATVIGIFENLYKNNKPLTVVKPGTQTRCFTHIEDIVKGLILIGQKGVGDDYHLGFKESKSILDIVKMFDTDYVFIDERNGNRKSSEVQSDKCLNELNWEAKYRIEDYIDKIKEIKKNNKL